MANPTLYYSWTLPTEGQDPWHTALEDAFNAIDTTVQSVQLISRTRVMLVLSVQVASGMLFVASSVERAGGDGSGFFTMSCADYGAYVGSFSLIGSGAQAVFNVTLSGYSEAGSVYEGGVMLYYRGVISRAGVNSLTIPSVGSHWKHSTNVTECRDRIPLTAVMSLGPGNYRFELQCQPERFMTCSRWVQDANDMVECFVTEAIA